LAVEKTTLGEGLGEKRSVGKTLRGKTRHSMPERTQAAKKNRINKKNRRVTTASVKNWGKGFETPEGLQKNQARKLRTLPRPKKKRALERKWRGQTNLQKKGLWGGSCVGGWGINGNGRNPKKDKRKKNSKAKTQNTQPEKAAKRKSADASRRKDGF